MLGGIDPVIVFHFNIKKFSPTLNSLEKIPQLQEVIRANAAVPIPIYLSQRLTGIVITEESVSIDVETNSQEKADGTNPDVKQRGVGNLVTIGMSASGRSVGLKIFLALIDQCMRLLAQQTYSISYFNGDTLILNGLIHGFQKTTATDTDRIDMSLVLSKSNLGGTRQDTLDILNKVRGITPLTTGGA